MATENIEEELLKNDKTLIKYVSEEHDTKEITNSESIRYNLRIEMKDIKLGKDYKKSKLYFINNFQNYLKYNKDSKKLVNITENIISRLFNYLDIFLIYDLEDMVYILYKRNHEDIKTSMQIFSYVENTFNDKLYSTLIDKIVKQRYNVCIKSNNYLDEKEKVMFEEYFQRNSLLYISIIKTEILKILMLKRLITSYLLHYGDKIEYMTILQKEMIASFHILIKKSKTVIIHYYNDLKNNFSFCTPHIEDCKAMIISNKILS